MLGNSILNKSVFVNAVILFFVLSSLSCKDGQELTATPPKGAEMLFDGSLDMLNEKWTYWEGPRFAGALPIKWQIVDDPLSNGTVLNSNDKTAGKGQYGAADIVTKKKYRDFRLHVEFLVEEKGGNSGVYLQNRYEIQIFDGDSTIHGMGAVINEAVAEPGSAYNGIGKWNTYDIMFRAARFKNGTRSEKARVTMYFNSIKVHDNQPIDKVWGGKNSGLDGGKEVTDSPGGIKLQAEGHSVLFRNIWIKEMNIKNDSIIF